MGENEGRRGLKKEEKISITFSLCTLLKPLKAPTKAMIISQNCNQQFLFYDTSLLGNVQTFKVSAFTFTRFSWRV